MVGDRLTQEHGHQLIERNGVAVPRSVQGSSSNIPRSLLGENPKAHNVTDHLLSECMFDAT